MMQCRSSVALALYSGIMYTLHYISATWQGAEDATSVAATYKDFRMRLFRGKNTPHRRMEEPYFIPLQPNGWDCGLFMLTFMHFFSHSLPTEISLGSLISMPGDLTYP